MADTKRCFICGETMNYDSTTGRYTCPICGNVEYTVLDQGE